jgi:hypothetical protein
MPAQRRALPRSRRCRGRPGGRGRARASAARGSTARHDEDCGAGDAEHCQRGGTPGGQRGHPARNRHGIHPARSAACSGRSPRDPGHADRRVPGEPVGTPVRDLGSELHRPGPRAIRAVRAWLSPWIALQRCWQAWSNAPWKRQGITFGTPVQRSAQGLLISELLEFIGASSTVESASACLPRPLCGQAAHDPVATPGRFAVILAPVSLAVCRAAGWDHQRGSAVAGFGAAGLVPGRVRRPSPGALRDRG